MEVRRERPDVREPEAEGAVRKPVANDRGVEALLSLQQTAGNAAVSRMLAATRMLAREDQPAAPPAPAAPAPPVKRQDYVFYMGDVKGDAFFKEAALFFTQEAPNADRRQAGSLEEILTKVNAGKDPAGKIVIVTHGNADGTMQFKLTAKTTDKDTSLDELTAANQAGGLPKADTAKIDKDTQVLIRGCNVGRSAKTLDALDQAFGGAVSVTAPKHEQRYGHDAGGSRETFSGYYHEEKGDATKKYDLDTLVTVFSGTYGFVPRDQWPAILKPVLADRTGDKLIYDRQGPYMLDVSKAGPAPSQSTLEAMAKADLSRPEAYGFTPIAKEDLEGDMVRYSIFAHRTEFRARHVEIKQSGAPYKPRDDERDQWWGDSTYAPPAPPAPAKP